MITCKKCNTKFNLEEVKTAAGLTSSNEFIGNCPICDYYHKSDIEFPEAKHSDKEIKNIADGIELADDNLCQRLVNELYKRGWNPTSYMIQ